MLIRPTFRYLSRVVPFPGTLPYFEPVGQEVVAPPAIVTAPAAVSVTSLAAPSRSRSFHPSPPRLLGLGPLAYQEPEDVIMEPIIQCKFGFLVFTSVNADFILFQLIHLKRPVRSFTISIVFTTLRTKSRLSIKRTTPHLQGVSQSLN